MILKKFCQALVARLGLRRAVRFLQSLGGTSGDYTTERAAWLKNEDLASIRARIEASKRKDRAVLGSDLKDRVSEGSDPDEDGTCPT